MDSGLTTSLSGALAQSKRIEVISNNIANADTVGFKASELAFEESLAAQHRSDQRSDIPERPYKDSELLTQAGKEVRPVLYGQEFTSLRAGSMKQTGNPLDIAIEGNGFLEVLTPEGIRLTRAGNLALEAGGRIVTRDGFLVLGPGNAGTDAALRAISVNSPKVTIDQEGNIYAANPLGAEANQTLGRLSLVSVTNPQALKKIGQNLFEASPEAGVLAVGQPRPANVAAVAPRNPASVTELNPGLPKTNPLGSQDVAPRVHQGMLESSNVNPIEQMSQMIEAHRLFDQNTKSH